MLQIDLEPNRYRQVSGREIETAKRAPEPIFTPAAPVVLAVLFCLWFGFWLASVELHAIVNWAVTPLFGY